MVVALGLVHGISFSASYQLVSRFAGKNTISLGLGCVGSGFIVLLMELALRLKSNPNHHQSMELYLACSGTYLLLNRFLCTKQLCDPKSQLSPQNLKDAPQGSSLINHALNLII